MEQWLYCDRCKRVYYANQIRTSRHCTYDGCAGNYKDIWFWETIRDLNIKLNYPEIPMQGVVYPFGWYNETE